MNRLFHNEAAEQWMLCSIAFVCYSTILASLIALWHSLSALALSAAGEQIAALYSHWGV